MHNKGDSLAVKIFAIIACPFFIWIVAAFRENVTSWFTVWLSLAWNTDVSGDATSALRAASGISADWLPFPSVPLSNAALAIPLREVWFGLLIQYLGSIHGMPPVGGNAVQGQLSNACSLHAAHQEAIP